MRRAASLQRLLALAAVALLAAIGALAATSARGHGSKDEKPLPKPSSTWYRALAAPYARPTGRRTACGIKLRATTMGVAHPVLPCGVKIFLSYGKTRVLTEVIDRGPYVPGREFDLTKPLADRIGLHGTQPIRWAFAR
jgi:rare lipoprotein A (peptidoglycan hydrolase)